MPRAGTREGGCLLQVQSWKEGLQGLGHKLPMRFNSVLKQCMGPNTHPSGSLRQPLEVGGSIAEPLKAKQRQSQI